MEAYLELDDIEYIEEIELPFVYDLTIEKNHNYFILSGKEILVHNSGKSHYVAQRYIYKCLKEPFFRLIYCRKIARTIRASQFQLFKDLISQADLGQFFTIKEANMEIVCKNGNMMIAAGLDDREKIKSITDPTDVWVEETTEFEKEDIIQLNLRLRTKKSRYNQLVMSFNPISTDHWLYDSLIVKKDLGAKVIKTTYLDNKFLPEDYKRELDKLKDVDENYYKVYCLGEWGGQRKGLIYTHWKLTDHFPDFVNYIYGLDFGFNNETALTRIGIADKNVWIEEVIYQKGLTNSDLIRKLKELKIGRETIYADPAEPGRIEEIYRAGFNIKPADKGPDSVRKGIDLVKSMPVNILDNSPNLIKELNNYIWETDKNGNIIDDKPVKFMDHLCDSFRMALHTHIGSGKGKYSISII